jgi:hypothetical protein
MNDYSRFLPPGRKESPGQCAAFPGPSAAADEGPGHPNWSAGYWTVRVTLVVAVTAPCVPVTEIT